MNDPSFANQIFSNSVSLQDCKKLKKQREIIERQQHELSLKKEVKHILKNMQQTINSSRRIDPDDKYISVGTDMARRKRKDIIFVMDGINNAGFKVSIDEPIHHFDQERYIRVRDPEVNMCCIC